MSNASWDCPDILAPTIEVLRTIARNFNDPLGANQGAQHAPPGLTIVIAMLMERISKEIMTIAVRKVEFWVRA